MLHWMLRSTVRIRVRFLGFRVRGFAVSLRDLGFGVEGLGLVEA